MFIYYFIPVPLIIMFTYDYVIYSYKQGYTLYETNLNKNWYYTKTKQKRKKNNEK